MKQTFTLLLLALLGFGGNVFAQSCTSQATSYDLTVTSLTIIPPVSSSSTYMQGYICPGATLIDSAMCCTRFCNVDSLATMIVGPNSYGMAYVKGGGTFNGQGASANWVVFAEPGASIINHTGTTNQCPAVVFTGGNCTMGFNTAQSMKPDVALKGNQLNFTFNTTMSDVHVELLDVNGKVVKSETMDQSSVHSMDVSGLASGVYMYRMMQGTEVVSSDKIILQ